MKIYTMTIDSRQRDPRTFHVVKNYNMRSGEPESYKPIREITVSENLLSPLALFIARNGDAKFIGGMVHGFTARVEGVTGSRYRNTLEKYGEKIANDTKIAYNWSDDERDYIESWLFPVIEPEQTDDGYLNAVAESIISVAGIGGRVIINGNIFDIN